MRLLVLGGTVFLGRAVARIARDAGHDVVCAARGASGESVDGVEFVRIDRDEPDGLDALTGDFDALVDVTHRPSHARAAVARLEGRVGHATFVSTGSVYADHAAVGGRVEDTPVLPMADFDDPTTDAEAYGRCKLSCEHAYREGLGDERVFVCRAGLIIGPEDTSGRFGYWARRAARGGDVLAPGAPDDLVQFVDVRDLAAWIVDAAGLGLAGTFDGVGAPMPRGAFLEALIGAVAPAGTTLTFVEQSYLTGHGVEPWSGPRSLPMWVPLPEYAGFMSRDATASLSAGLRTRPVAETARDTVATGYFGKTIGLTEEEEADLLRAYRDENE